MPLRQAVQKWLMITSSVILILLGFILLVGDRMVIEVRFIGFAAIVTGLSVIGARWQPR
jgi:uncharacterized membrane protein HdeD (DUF308 family)